MYSRDSGFQNYGTFSLQYVQDAPRSSSEASGASRFSSVIFELLTPSQLCLVETVLLSFNVLANEANMLQSVIHSGHGVASQPASQFPTSFLSSRPGSCQFSRWKCIPMYVLFLYRPILACFDTWNAFEELFILPAPSSTLPSCLFLCSFNMAVLLLQK